MTTITDRQREVLERIYRLDSAKGYPPSIRELCAALGLRSTSTVWYFLEVLREQGLVDRERNLKNRTVRLTDEGKHLIGVKTGICPTCGGTGSID